MAGVRGSILYNVIMMSCVKPLFATRQTTSFARASHRRTLDIHTTGGRHSENRQQTM